MSYQLVRVGPLHLQHERSGPKCSPVPEIDAKIPSQTHLGNCAPDVGLVSPRLLSK